MSNSSSAFRPLNLVHQPLSYKGDTMINDDLHNVHAHAERLEVHKMKITNSICENGRDARSDSREFSALPSCLEVLNAAGIAVKLFVMRCISSRSTRSTSTRLFPIFTHWCQRLALHWSLHVQPTGLLSIANHDL